MFSKRHIVLAGGSLALALSGQSANAQAVFTITRPSFKDGELLAKKNGRQQQAESKLRRRQRLARAVLVELPAGTKSFALLMTDPEGRPPGGVSHWVAYGIPASVTGFAEGEAGKQTDKYVGGKGLMGLPHLFRPLHAAGRAASLHLHLDRHRSRAEGAASPASPGRADQGSTATSRGRPASSARSRSRNATFRDSPHARPVMTADCILQRHRCRIISADT